MSEKRFKKMDTIIDPFPIWDTVEEKGYNCTDTLDLLVGLLNEQQSTIEQKDKQLEKAKEYFMDYLSREMSTNNFSELWDLVIDDE